MKFFFPPYRTGDTFISAVILKCLKLLIHHLFNIKHITPAGATKLLSD
jgi:hypothetical protein